MYKLYNKDYKKILPQIRANGGGGKNIIIVTDPPYNICFKYNTYKDNLPEQEYLQMITNLITTYPSVIIIYHEILHKITAYSQKTPDKVMEWIYNSNLQRQHKAIAYYDVLPNLEKVRQPYKNPNDKRVQRQLQKGKNGTRSYDWWNIQQVKSGSKEKGTHPCPTPLKLMDNIIKCIPEEYVVFDPFMGSGTTGVAAIINGRDFIGAEIDELYYREAKNRMDSMLHF